MIIDLSSMPTGTKPAGFTEALTGHGEPVRWLVLDDQSAPTGAKVIAETSNDTADYRSIVHLRQFDCQRCRRIR